MTHTISTISALRLLGYRCEVWPCGKFAGVPMAVLEITDLKTAATVYVPESATLEQALQAINDKNEQFDSASREK